MLDDKYRIERLLATGGMGAVYLGTHIKLRKRVAIKVLNPQLSSAPMVERFHREAITASQIGHEGIAQVTDMGTSSEGEPFLVMEYLEGESLAKRLRESGPMSVEDACEMGCAILSPLSAAHNAGIVHRDLKPDNVFLVRQSRGEMVKLLDFGISRAAGVEREFRLTNTGLVLGTPYYMSPEQARGESEITPAADLYAFGVILYEMLVGDVPIRAENYNQLMYRVTVGEFERPRERRPELPEDLERVVLHAMAQLPADRPASAVDLEDELLGFCRPVFRDHASGRLSSPGFLLKKIYSGSLDPALLSGATTPEKIPGDPHPVPAETGHDPMAVADTENNGYAALTSQSALSESDSQAVPASASVSEFASTSEDLNPPTSEVRRRRRAPRLLTGVVIMVAGAAVAGAAVIALARHDGASVAVAPIPPPPTPSPTTMTTTTLSTPISIARGAPATPSTQPTTDRDGSTEGPAPTTISLRLAVEPPGAVITLDGARVSAAELVVPKDAAAHRLRITAAGYLGYDEKIAFDESQRLVVQLKRTASWTRGKPPPKDSTKPERIESKSPYE
jgi:serine/threonine-protein kinase